MSTQTLIADVIDGLYDLWKVDAALVALGVQLRDGDEPSDRTAPLELWVGGTGLDDDTEAASSDREWAHASAMSDIDEWVRVTCAAWAWSGDTDGRAQRRAAVGLLDAAAAAIRDSTLGLALRVLWCEVIDVQLRQIQDGNGSAAVFTFTVRARCRIEPN